jgi:hypothetical protein
MMGQAPLLRAEEQVVVSRHVLVSVFPWRLREECASRILLAGWTLGESPYRSEPRDVDAMDGIHQAVILVGT